MRITNLLEFLEVCLKQCGPRIHFRMCLLSLESQSNMSTVGGRRVLIPPPHTSFTESQHTHAFECTKTELSARGTSRNEYLRPTYLWIPLERLDTKGLTVQLWVGDIESATAWYNRLLGRAPDFVPSPDFKEWEVVPDTWLQISASRNPGQMSRLRLGVKDLAKERKRLIEELGIEATEIERLEGAAAWFNFQDPWGNRIGLFQDLAKYP